MSALDLARRLSVGAVETSGIPTGPAGPPRPRPPQLDPGPPAIPVAVLSCDRGRLRWSPGGVSLAERLGWWPGPLAVTCEGLWTTLGVERGAGALHHRLRPDAALLGDGRLWLGSRLRATVAASGRVLVAVSAGRLVLADPTTVVAAAGLVGAVSAPSSEQVRP